VAINQELQIQIRFGEGKMVPVRVTDLEEEPPLAPGAETALSKVRWTENRTTSGFGVEFFGLKADVREYLERLVAYFERLQKAGVTF
jgi:hypothetical protein